MVRIDALVWSYDTDIVAVNVLRARMLNDSEEKHDPDRDVTDAVGKTLLFTFAGAMRRGGIPVFTFGSRREDVSPGVGFIAGIMSDIVLPRVVLVLPRDFEPTVSFAWGEQKRDTGYDAQPVIGRFEVTDAFDVGQSKNVIVEGRAIQSPTRVLVGYALSERTTLLDVTARRVRFVNEVTCAAAHGPSQEETINRPWVLPKVLSYTIAEIARKDGQADDAAGTVQGAN